MKLPAYIDGETVSDGQNTFRSYQPGNAIGSGLASLSHGLGQIGRNMQANENYINAKAEGEAKRRTALNDQNDSLDIQLDLSKQLQASRSDMPTNGEGFQANHEKYAEQRIQDLLAKSTSTDKEQLERRLRQAAKNSIIQAGAYEEQAFKAGVAETFDKTARTMQADIAATPTPERFEAVVKEGHAFAEQLGYGPNATARFKAKLEVQAAKAFLASHASDPAKAQALVDKIAPAFSGERNPATVPDAASPQGIIINKTKAAVDSGLNPHDMLAIAYIESRFDKNATGKSAAQPKNTAKGIWQFPDAESRRTGSDPMDVHGQTDAMITKMVAEKAVIDRTGTPITPGKLYSMHLLGGGAGRAMLQSDPGSTVYEAMRKVWSPEFAQKAILGNKSMFPNGAATTVEQFYATTERLMGDARDKTAKYLSGEADPEFEKRSRANVASVFGRDIEGLTSADMLEAVGQARKTLDTDAKKKSTLSDADNYLTGRLPFDNRSAEHTKSIDGLATATFLGTRIRQGEPEAAHDAMVIAAKLNYVPKEAINAWHDAILNPITDKNKYSAYANLHELKENNPIALSSSHVPEEMKKDVEQYRALVNFGMSPEKAVVRIEELRKPEFKKEAHQADEAIRQQKMLQTATFADLTKNDNSLFSASAKSLSPDQEFHVEALYKDAYRFHLVKNGLKDPSAALDMARQEIHDMMRVSTAFGDKRFMPFAPDHKSNAINGSHLWIGKQAQDVIKDSVQKYDVPVSDIRLVPDYQTATEHRLGREPSYILQFKAPGSSAYTDYRGGRFTPNYQMAVNDYLDKNPSKAILTRDFVSKNEAARGDTMDSFRATARARSQEMQRNKSGLVPLDQ